LVNAVKKLFRELRRRNVFRTAGIYIGLALGGIEAANNILPLFEAPEWISKVIAIALMAGFPVVIFLAWYYEFTSEGILTDEEAIQRGTTGRGSTRKKDFAVIAFLAVALGFSLVMNFTHKGGPAVEKVIEPVSVLIANFDNQTGDPIFQGTLEQSMSLGLEGASFITSYPRESAVRLAEKLSPGAPLNAATAQLVAVREGIKLVLSGYIKSDGAGYQLNVSAINAETNEKVADSTVEAKDKAAVLAAISSLSDQVRKDLGDVSIDDARETFTSASLEAAHLYVEGKNLSNSGNDTEAIEKYKLALEADPNFGRVYAGWGNSANRLGRVEESAEAWKKALELLDSMTEREKYRTLGTYYMNVTGNYAKAIESYTQLLEHYPADDASYNNLAVAYFLNLQFTEAKEAGKRALDIYPKISLYRGNFALYAMYAGDFQSAIEMADVLIKDDPGFYVPWLARAMSLGMKGDYGKADADYQAMAKLNAQAASFAALGQADLRLYQGLPDGAIELLNSGIQSDLASRFNYLAVTKLIVRARAQELKGDKKGAMASLKQALELRPSTPQRALIALEYVDMGEHREADDVSQPLQHMLQPQARAWWSTVHGENQLAQGNVVVAVGEFEKAIALADLWRARLGKGKAYLAAEYMAEALAEFEACERRRGEAAAILLDDEPTLNYVSELYYWMAQAQRGLGMKEAASQNLELFLSHREGLKDPMTEDARRLLALP
jgi:tetratricopeptide (TPR) repeat protein